MCLKFDDHDNEIFILESTSNLGVHLIRFSNLVKHIGVFYTRIALRRLNFDRKEEQLELLETFIKNTLGKPYSFRLT
jgi:hypothetical protein